MTVTVGKLGLVGISSDVVDIVYADEENTKNFDIIVDRVIGIMSKAYKGVLNNLRELYCRYNDKEVWVEMIGDKEDFFFSWFIDKSEGEFEIRAEIRATRGKIEAEVSFKYYEDLSYCEDDRPCDWIPLFRMFASEEYGEKKTLYLLELEDPDRAYVKRVLNELLRVFPIP